MKSFKKCISILLVIITILTTFSVAVPVFAAGMTKAEKGIINNDYFQSEMTSKIAREAETFVKNMLNTLFVKMVHIL